MSVKRKRIIYAFIAFVCLLSGMMLVVFSEHLGFLRGSAGDYLVVIFMYTVIKLFVPGIIPLRLAIGVLVLSFTVEFIQMLHPDRLFNTDSSILLELSLGTTFDFSDLLMYTAGCISVLVFDMTLMK